MKNIYFLLITFLALYTVASEKDEVKKTIQEYMTAYMTLDYEKMYSYSHPELLKKLKGMLLESLPTVDENPSKSNDKEIQKVLSMLQVKSIKEARELSDKDFYYRFWKFMNKSGTMDAFKLIEINNLDIKVSKKDNYFVAVLSGKTQLLDKAISGSRNIEIKKLNNRFLISNISKTKFKNNKLILDKAGMEISLPQSWKKNQTVSIEVIKKKYNLPPEKLKEIEEQLNAMLLSYSTYEPREKQKATIVISKNSIDDSYTLKEVITESITGIKQNPIYNNAKIIENGCPKIKIVNYESLYIETNEFKQYTYVFFYEKNLISININTDKIKVDEIIDSILPLKEL
ncbi:MAG: hypothetical protein NE328_24485 [Lentisphaeraceae bacterium]|nr:hypothetical protein [Lentisphaeraceae bacterium]